LYQLEAMTEMEYQYWFRNRRERQTESHKEKANDVPETWWWFLLR